jgi:hypothetical protein
MDVTEQRNEKVAEVPAIEIIDNYQKMIANMLGKLYPSSPILTEWKSVFDKGIYSPRVDIAVGPFAVPKGQQFADEYDNLMNSSESFICRMIQCHLNHVGSQDGDTPAQVLERLKNANPNARCFMAVEVENKTSTKHIVGATINATALGRIGIVVAGTERALGKSIRVVKYLSSKGHGIFQFNAANLLILSKDELQHAIQDTKAELHTTAKDRVQT